MDSLNSGDEFESLLIAEHGDQSSSLMDQPTNADVARALAQRGLPVFPVRDWGDGDGWKPVRGFQAKATADEAQVRAWWNRWPESRVGLLTGETAGVSVLDLDIKGGKDGVASLARLGFTDLASMSPVRVRTPSGGWHLYFRFDPRLKNSVGKIGDGIDVKTAGGFVIAPGSLKDGMPYRQVGAVLGTVDLPRLPDALVPPPSPEIDTAEVVADPTESQRAWAATDLRRRADALAAMLPDSGRNDALNQASYWAGRAAAGGFITRPMADEVLWAAAANAGMRKREFQATFKSGFSAGLKKPIANFPREVITTADEFDELEESSAPPAAEASRLRFLSPGECADAPSRGYVIKGLLAPGDVGCIYGAPGAGKSLISPHLGYAVAQGRTAFGMRTKPGKVFYVAAEDPHGMRGRVSALQRKHGDADAFMLVEGVSDLLDGGSTDFAALYTAVKEQRPSLIYIDTLAMAFPGLEENSADAMGRVVAIARKLASYGAAVVLIHHDTKAGTPTPRGHSLLNGALDMALQLFARDEAGIVRGKLTKNRNGSCDTDVAFRIATEVMGVDEDGDPVTYALVDEIAGGPASSRQKLSPSERAALIILKDLVELFGEPVVPEDSWRKKCVDGRTVSGSDDAESRKRATRRAVEGLARKGAVVMRDGTATLPHWALSATIDGEQFDDLDAEPTD